jgi:DNA repair protein RadC
VSVDEVVAVPERRLTAFPDLIRTMSPNVSVKAPYEPAEGGAARYLSRLVVVGPGGKLPKPGPVIRSSKDVAHILRPMVNLDVEHYVCCSIDAQYRLMAISIVGVGGKSSVTAAKRDILKVPLLIGAAAIIGAHNHPTHSSRPSLPDKGAGAATERLCKLIGIRYLDDLIIAPEGYYSFADETVHDWSDRPIQRWSNAPTKGQLRRAERPMGPAVLMDVLHMGPAEKAHFADELRRMSPEAREHAIRTIRDLAAERTHYPVSRGPDKR